MLSEAEISRIERFGERRKYARGERLFAAGERAPGMFVVLKGTLKMSLRDGLGRVVPVVRHGPGQFTGEIAQLSGGFALVDADAEDDVEVLLIPPDRIRALIVADAELGERIVRVDFTSRGSDQSGRSGAVLIGELHSPDMLRLRNFLRRNGQPHHAVEPSEDAAAAMLLTQYGAGPDDVLVVCPNGSTLLTPSEDALARCLGMLDTLERNELFDVVVVGAGPAGLATAVYGSVGGIADHCRRVPLVRGQAGASTYRELSWVSDHLGSGSRSGRAFVQAQVWRANANTRPGGVARLHQGGDGRRRVDGETQRRPYAAISVPVVLRRACVIAVPPFHVSPSSKAEGSGTGRRHWRQSCALARRLPSSAAATLPDKPPCTSPNMRQRFTCKYAAKV